ncbi:single-stranded DNA-binding protein [Cutibacterium granulosum]|uniref:single-stranded DNA-binding protein n=1 Tax=Cutibacterium granulosum TaxID=33011 RepID=UPI002B237A10|nr:single-stranded DNA-binding protein [Cutibacterium granulosum]MEA5655101.1 single-stranded DNA-binding protein [Cutibacterium granulosum]
MSYIVRTGNLAGTPELREGEHGPYTFARVIVSDRIRQEDGSYVNGPAIAYDVLVSGNQAVNLVDAAKASGNIRITFAGRYRITEWRGDQGTRIEHEVRANEVSVSLLGQKVTVERPRGDVASQETTSF